MTMKTLTRKLISFGRKKWPWNTIGLEEKIKKKQVNTVVYAPPWQSTGGVKSLYAVCEYMNELGRSHILPFAEPKLAEWFEHNCKMFDGSFFPDIAIYPEVYQPFLSDYTLHICFVLGKYDKVKPHADVVVCKTRESADWVKGYFEEANIVVVRPAINKKIFEYDGRPKKKQVCYMTKGKKSPELALLLRERFGNAFVEIVNQPESKVAEILKESKVFVWRGNEKEGSPRPPKEAFVAGCVVVGLKDDEREKSPWAHMVIRYVVGDGRQQSLHIVACAGPTDFLQSHQR